MSESIDFEQRQREDARWKILRVIDAGRPVPVSEQVIWRVLTDVNVPFSLNQVRRELAYLRDLTLLDLTGQHNDTWFATLTAGGVDVVEYTATAPAGIARPRKYR